VKKPAGAVIPAKRQDRLSESIEMMHRMFQSVDLFSRQALRDFGVTGPQIWAMRTIEQSGFSRMTDLAQSMHLHMSTVTGIIGRLEAARLVTRSRASTDGRVIELRLTSRGRAILARAPEPPRSKASRGLQKLSRKQLQVVHAALLLIAKAMEIDVQKD
jgi:DNA-binding MarR family transcriptional regulator